MSSTDSTSCTTPTVITTSKILDISGVDPPEVTSAITASATFDEAFIEGQIMTDTVSPTAIIVAIKWKVLLDVLVDITEEKSLVR